MGSSHGYTRVIRLAYHEDPSYVSLLRRAYDCWEELEAEYGRQLLYRTGSVSAGRPSTELVSGSREACERHSLEYETLSGAELSERFPGFALPEGFEAIYQPDGGFVRAEQSIVAHVERAHAHGAEIHARERVESWQSTTDGVRVTTDKGRYAADRLVVVAGAWTGELIESLGSSLTPERNVAGWFQPDRPGRYVPESFPVFGIQNDGTLHYGIPAFDVPGIKIGRHHHFGETVDPDEMAREPTSRRRVRRHTRLACSRSIDCETHLDVMFHSCRHKTGVSDEVLCLELFHHVVDEGVDVVVGKVTAAYLRVHLHCRHGEVAGLERRPRTVWQRRKQVHRAVDRVVGALERLDELLSEVGFVDHISGYTGSH